MGTVVSDAVLVAIVSGLATALPLIAVQVANIIVSRQNGRKLDAVQDGMKTRAVLAEAKMLDAATGEATAVGHAAGVAQERARGLP